MKIKKIIFVFILAAFISLPVLSLAQLPPLPPPPPFFPFPTPGGSHNTSVSGSSSGTISQPQSITQPQAITQPQSINQPTSITQPTSYQAPTSSTGFCVLPNRPTFAVLANYFVCIISRSIIPLLFALAIAMFIWGVIQYVINTDEEAKKQKGKMFMIWGIIALAVMVSVWGLVGILRNTFGIENVIPQLQT